MNLAQAVGKRLKDILKELDTLKDEDELIDVR